MRGTAGKNFYRRLSLKAQTQSVPPLPEPTLFTLEQAFGGWVSPTRRTLPMAPALTRFT